MLYRTFGREALSVVFKAFVVVVTTVFIFVFINTWYEMEPVSDGSCNIAVFPLEGVILPFTGFDDFELAITPGSVRDFISAVEQDDYIQGILFEINSPGGTPVAAEQISEYISSTYLPTIGLIGDIGASGAYLVAASTDTIIASPMSDVGSIGVTMSYVENSEQNEEEGLTFVELTTGKYKEAGNPNKPLSAEERALFEADLQIVHDAFVKQIAAYRGRSEADIQALADGASMPGITALEKGLVDKLGGRSVARDTFASILEINPAEVVFCEYENDSLFLY